MSTTEILQTLTNQLALQNLPFLRIPTQAGEALSVRFRSHEGEFGEVMLYALPTQPIPMLGMIAQGLPTLAISEESAYALLFAFNDIAVRLPIASMKPILVHGEDDWVVQLETHFPHPFEDPRALRLLTGYVAAVSILLGRYLDTLTPGTTPEEVLQRYQAHLGSNLTEELTKITEGLSALAVG